MRYALRSEWTKLRTLPSTGWLLLLAVGCTVALGFAITGPLELDRNGCVAPCLFDTTRLSLSGVRLGQVGVALVAVLAVTAEYGTRTIVPTVTAVPRRFVVVLAKLIVVTTLGVVAGLVAVAGSLGAARPVLSGNGFTAVNGYPALSLDDDLTRRAAGGTVLYLGLIALLSAGIGFLVRDTAAAITTVLAALYGSPIVAMFVTNPRWQHRIHRFSPMDAGLSIQSTRDFAAAHIGPWGGLGLLGVYAAVAVIVGLVAFQIRDA